MVGEPRLREHGAERVVVVCIKINVNQKSLTIEEMLRQRKRTVVAVGEGLAKEIRSGPPGAARPARPAPRAHSVASHGLRVRAASSSRA